MTPFDAIRIRAHGVHCPAGGRRIPAGPIASALIVFVLGATLSRAAAAQPDTTYTPPAPSADSLAGTPETPASPPAMAPAPVPPPPPAPPAPESLPWGAGNLPAWMDSCSVPDSLAFSVTNDENGVPRSGLERALGKAGFAKWARYLWQDSTLVVACPPERVDGKGVPESDRWSTVCAEEPPSNPFVDLWHLITFHSTTCRVRVLAFVVGAAPPGAGANKGEMGWLGSLTQGSGTTPGIARRSETARCWALVYWFERKSGDDSQFVPKRGPRAALQLQNAGLWPERSIRSQ